MDSITVAIIAAIVGSPILATVSNQLVESWKQRQDRPQREKLQELEIRQKKLENDRASVEMVRQALIDFPFLYEAILDTPYGYRGVKKTGNTHHPIVLVEREKHGIRLSWEPKDIEGFYS